jgi:hypothetical protein
MEPLTMGNLVQNFKTAKEQGAKFIGILINMDGFPKNEVIINESENFDSKLKYYQATYDSNLNHRFAKGISIVGFTYGDSFDDIQSDLIY